MPRARNLSKKLLELARYYPVVSVTGPRQSGKSTLCAATFPKMPRVSLEPLDARAYAVEDPRGFLEEHADGAIIDEVQHAPGLLSYMQEEVDRDPRPGRFILTGSEHLGISQAVSQSLAGRAGIIHLLPLSLDEIRRFPEAPTSLFDILWRGGYPRIYDRKLPADRWLRDYTTNYVERDVRRLLNVGDLSTFSTFMKLCAANVAQELNLSRLGGDCGVSHNTARAWLSALEASYICTRVPVWLNNVRKQWVKAPKLFFLDSGLVCHLLGIQEPEQLRHHPLRGAIFESWVASEVLKARAHAGLAEDLFHLRQSRGLEVDLVVDDTHGALFVEAKSGETVDQGFLKNLLQVRDLFGATLKKPMRLMLVSGGAQSMRRSGVEIVAWSDLSKRLLAH